MKKKFTVEETPAKIIADGIKEIQKAMNQILNAGLKKSTIIILVQAKTKLNQRDIEAVIDSLDSLAKDYTK